MEKHIHVRLHAYIVYLRMAIGALAIFSAIILSLRFFVISPGTVNGPSMESNFMDNDFFWVNKFHYFFSEPKRFEVVQVVNVKDKKLTIKRIIGLPGDRITIKRGFVYVQKSFETSETQLAEPYLNPDEYTAILGQNTPQVFTVQAGEYFILGDNRDRSIDSRHYGPISRRMIIGRVVADYKK